jgi:hypothetical protein
VKLKWKVSLAWSADNHITPFLSEIKLDRKVLETSGKVG